jgi:hypothetical protein
MNRNTLYALMTGAALAGALTLSSWALAAPPDDAAPVVRSPAAERCAARCAHGARTHRSIEGRRARLAHAVQNNPAAAVVVNLRAIERVYWREGRVKELPVFYRDVLARTDDPLVRNFVNYRLARLARMDGNARDSLDALRRNLEENLRRLPHEG